MKPASPVDDAQLEVLERAASAGSRPSEPARAPWRGRSPARPPGRASAVAQRFEHRPSAEPARAQAVRRRPAPAAGARSAPAPGGGRPRASAGESDEEDQVDRDARRRRRSRSAVAVVATRHDRALDRCRSLQCGIATPPPRPVQPSFSRSISRAASSPASAHDARAPPGAPASSSRTCLARRPRESDGRPAAGRPARRAEPRPASAVAVPISIRARSARSRRRAACRARTPARSRHRGTRGLPGPRPPWRARPRPRPSA